MGDERFDWQWKLSIHDAVQLKSWKPITVDSFESVTGKSVTEELVSAFLVNEGIDSTVPAFTSELAYA